MCGIVGYIGPRVAQDFLLEGLLIKRNLLPMTIVGLVVGIIGLILVYTIGSGMI